MQLAFAAVRCYTCIDRKDSRYPMRNAAIENEMYRRAVALIESRYPAGWGGAGVVHTAKGNYYTSVSIVTANASAIVCNGALAGLKEVGRCISSTLPCM